MQAGAMTDLEAAVYRSIQYGDIFEQPLTATQIWRALIVSKAARLMPRLSAVRVAVENLVDQRVLDARQGYYFLAGRGELVAQRQQRFWLAQDKWKVTQRVVGWLKLVPFVRMIAMSGSLAVANTGPHSDLDLFVVVRRGRIWTARLFLLLATQLLGRRRKHWNAEAPDKVCLNHYLADDVLAISPEIRNLYTAMLYRHLIPLYGFSTYGQFQQVNADWINQQLGFVEAPFLPNILSLRASSVLKFIKRNVEQLLSEPIFDDAERLAERVQRAVISRHTTPNQPGRVALSSSELAFHPHTKVPAILEQFSRVDRHF